MAKSESCSSTLPGECFRPRRPEVDYEMAHRPDRPFILPRTFPNTSESACRRAAYQGIQGSQAIAHPAQGPQIAAVYSCWVDTRPWGIWILRILRHKRQAGQFWSATGMRSTDQGQKATATRRDCSSTRTSRADSGSTVGFDGTGSKTDLGQIAFGKRFLKLDETSNDGVMRTVMACGRWQWLSRKITSSIHFKQHTYAAKVK